jgi:hypothetical protein
MKRNVWKIVTACVLLASTCFLFASCAGSEKVKSGAGEVWEGVKEGVTEGVESLSGKETSGLSIDTSEVTEHISLTSLSTVASSESGTVTQIIKATVTPDFVSGVNDGIDRSTTWSAYWIENPYEEGTSVSDYITVDPCRGTGSNALGHQDGSNYCAVTCLQPFEGTIGVRVKTVDGGYTAECKVTFAGVPTEVTLTRVDSNKLDSVNSKTKLYAGLTYEFTLDVDNPFHKIGSDYGQYELVSYGTTGDIAYQKMNYDSSSSTENKSINLSDRTSEFFTVSLNGNSLKISVKKGLDDSTMIDEVFGSNSSSSSEYECYVNSLLTGTFYVTVRDKISGVESTYNFLTYKQSFVSAVALSDPSLAF